MIRLFFPFVFFICNIASPACAAGNKACPQDNRQSTAPVSIPQREGGMEKEEDKAGKIHLKPYPSETCTERCHVNYLAYRTIYGGEVFRHKTHSSFQGLECSECHNNDSAQSETHGNLTLQNNGCWICHHKSNSKAPDNPPYSKTHDTSSSWEKTGSRNNSMQNQENCLKCHKRVKEYIAGNSYDTAAIKPDWMSDIVFCQDCHIHELDGSAFKPVRESCISCHNSDYGLLYDAWKETLNTLLITHRRNDADPTDNRNIVSFIQKYGMHNFRLSQTLLKSLEND